MEKQKKSYGKTALVILLLIVTIASLVLATYAWAKYTSTKEMTATAQVAKWDVDVDLTNKDFEETFVHVLGHQLAPGTAGYFEINVKPNETEVDFDYEIILEKVENAPAHLHFYTAEGHLNTQEIDINKKPTEQTQTAAQDYLKGHIDVKGSAGSTTTETNTKKIYWEWPYEDPNDSKEDKKSIIGQTLSENGSGNGIPDYDDQDTIDGMNEKDVTVTVKVIATQTSPTKQD